MKEKNRNWLAGGMIVSASRGQVVLRVVLTVHGFVSGAIRLLGNHRFPLDENSPSAKPRRQTVKLVRQATWPRCPRVGRLEQILSAPEPNYGTFAFDLNSSLWESCGFVGFSLDYHRPASKTTSLVNQKKKSESIYVEVKRTEIFERSHHCFLMTAAQIDSRINDYVRTYDDVFGRKDDMADTALTNIYLKHISGGDHPLVTEDLRPANSSSQN